MKNNQKYVFGLLLLVSLFYFGLNDGSLEEGNKINQIDKNSLDTDLNYSPPLDQGMGISLYGNQYATTSTTYFPYGFPQNVSFTLAKDWCSQNVSLDFFGVSHKDDYITNGEFDYNDYGWNFLKHSQNSDFQDDYQSYYDCVKITIIENYFEQGDYGYYEQTISLDEALAEDQYLAFSVGYYFKSQESNLGDASAYLAVIINGVEKNLTVPTSDLVQDEWKRLNLVYDPSNIGQQLPGQITFRIGIVINENHNPYEDQYFYIDDIESEIWTSINESYLFNIHDHDLNMNFSYEGIDWGCGNAFNNISRSSNETRDITLTISKNSSYTEDIYVDKIILNSVLSKNFSSKFNSEQGSFYVPNSTVLWKTEIPFEMLPGYSENRAVINKPKGWEIIHILDSFGEDRISDCPNVGLENSSFFIPVDVLSGGLWELEALSNNLMEHGQTFRINNDGKPSSVDIYHGDQFMVNLTLKDDFPLEHSEMNFSILSPNGTLFYNDSKDPLSHNIHFGNFSVHNNMSAGEYQLKAICTNSKYAENRTMIAYYSESLDVHHHTQIYPISEEISLKAGDPLLIKVNFSDIDFAKPIAYADVRYNSTFGLDGIMQYVGSGIYVADIDTSSLNVGSYNFSVNASKNYYQNASKNSIISINIIEQQISLETPKNVIYASGNSFIDIFFNVTYKDTGALVSEANVSAKWQRSFSLNDYQNGTFSINASTAGLPLAGEQESSSISIFANKTNFGATTDFINIIIMPIPAYLTLNESFIEIYPNKTKYIEISFKDNNTDLSINSASLEVTWEEDYEVINKEDHFLVRFSSHNLPIGISTALIQAKKEGYAEVSCTVSFSILPIPTEIEILNEQPFSIIRGDFENLSCQILIDGSLCEDGTVTASLLGDYGGVFQKNGDAFFFTIDSNQLAPKSYLAQILVQGSHVQTAIKDIMFEVIPMELEIQLNKTSFLYEEGEGNKIEFCVLDCAHNVIRDDFQVFYCLDNESFQNLDLQGDMYSLNIEDLDLIPQDELYHLKILVENPYGEDAQRTIVITYPKEYDDNKLYLYLFLGSTALILFGLLAQWIKKEYSGLTEFQRLIKKQKMLIKKQEFSRNLVKKTREDILVQMFDEIDNR